MVRVHIDLPGEQDLNDFLTEFQAESDRAAAVLGAAYLDDLLEQLLEKSFADDSGSVRSLFGSMGPLSGFSAKIRMGRAFGLLTREDANDLHRIRKIRNLFAHESYGLNFDDESVAKHCSEFDCNRERFAAEQGLAAYPRNPRSLFDLAVALSSYYLKRRIQNAVAFGPAKPPLHLPYAVGGGGDSEAET